MEGVTAIDNTSVTKLQIHPYANIITLELKKTDTIMLETIINRNGTVCVQTHNVIIIYFKFQNLIYIKKIKQTDQELHQKGATGGFLTIGSPYNPAYDVCFFSKKLKTY